MALKGNGGTEMEITTNQHRRNRPHAFSGGKRYALRVGIALCVVPDHPNDEMLGSFQRKLVLAFKEDSRLVGLRTPEGGSKPRDLVVSATLPDESIEQDREAPALDAHNHILELSEPISFQVFLNHGPSERDSGLVTSYWVAWDGIAVSVMWDAHGAVSPFSADEGTLVFDLIATLTKEAGLKLRLQPCGDVCDYPFAHNEAILTPGANHSDFPVTRTSETAIEVACPQVRTPHALIRELSTAVNYTATVFSSLRSYGETVRQSETHARAELSEALVLQYEREQSSSTGFLRSVGRRWKRRKHNQKISRLIANLWLRLATIEASTSKWQDERYAFDSLLPRAGLAQIFAHEYPQQVTMMKSVRTANLEASVSQLTSRSDSRLVAIATVMGAMGGAVAAALVGLVTQLR